VQSLRRSHRLGAVAVLGLAFTAAACTTDSATPPATARQPVTTSTVRPDDGRLLIGVVSPRGGPSAELGASMRDSVTVAIDDINAHGGVNGQVVRTVVRDEGDNASTAAMAVQDLVQLGVDAIVGPTSSLNVLATLDTAVNAGVLTCSPTASALALDTFPDNGLLIRTVPSDSLQARAIARVVEQSGYSQAAVVYLDDAYGRPFAQAAQQALRSETTVVSLAMGFTPTEDSIQKTATAIAALHPKAVVVIADNSSGPSIITAIDSELNSIDPASKPTYIVNDAIRRPAPQAPPFGGSLAERVVGVSPEAYPRSTAFLADLRAIDADSTGLFAANAADCVNTIALSALAAKSTAATAMAAAVAGTTSNGTSCGSFSDCADDLADGRNIDYDGSNGALTIDRNGDVSTALFDRFGFDAAGRDATIGSVTIGAS
jgi:branched-chain amino acid transport system substrate-binding protein